MEINAIAANLERDPAGFWAAPASGEISYPADATDFCASVEDTSFWFEHRNRVIAAAVRRFPPADGPLFDVGAGNGFVSAALHCAGVDVVAIEPNPSGARNAVQRGIPIVIRGTLPSAVFRAEVAGGIGLFDVIEHIAEDTDYLRSLRPYLKPGGRLYVTTPAYPMLWSRDDEAAGHKRRYRLRGLHDVVGAAGYRVDYATYVFTWLPLPIAVLRTLPSALRRRDRGTFELSRSQHTAGGRAMRTLTRSLFAFETAFVSRGWRLPFGASCLLVATRA